MTNIFDDVGRDASGAVPGAAKDRQFVTALARGLAVLETFSDAEVMSPADITRRTGLAQATVWRICRTLLEIGYLTRIEGSDNLRPGPPVLRLGRNLLSRLRVLEVARPHMARLQAAHEGAITLAVRHGRQMICVERMEGHAVFSAATHAGNPISLMRGSVGWAHFAGLIPEDRADLISSLEAVADSEWVEMKGQILAALDAFAAAGYVTSRGTLHAAINAVAAPVHDAERQEVYSLSCGGLASVFDDAILRVVGPEVARTARRIEEELLANGDVV